MDAELGWSLEPSRLNGVAERLYRHSDLHASRHLERHATRWRNRQLHEHVVLGGRSPDGTVAILEARATSTRRIAMKVIDWAKRFVLPRLSAWPRMFP